MIFDDSFKAKRSRRKSSEVAFQKKQWEERVDKHFKRALEKLKWPDYVDTETMGFIMLNDDENNLPIQTLRRNFRSSMKRLGYVKNLNSRTKDGRFYINSLLVFAYKKCDLPDLGISTLKHELAT